MKSQNLERCAPVAKIASGHGPKKGKISILPKESLEIPSSKGSSENSTSVDLVALGNSQRLVSAFTWLCGWRGPKPIAAGEDPKTTGRLGFGVKRNHCDSPRQIIFINMMIPTIVLMLYSIDAMIEA